ncbi:uncharacterized protein [Aristolochia californica]|uniref:uncharacterized protein n=1 Tax=Aristolochia californica TaxID=171875 RepID=UPI0035D8D0E9
MECNKEEAIRAKELAEEKMQSKDFTGARKIARKAQQLFPELENISQMLSVCDIHCSAVLRAGGNEMDWYGVLQVELTADDATIRKQFRKLALLLHPDKNKFPGAEAAFKLIGEAQRVLLDPRKRSEHNMKRRSGVRTAAASHPPAPSNRNSYDRSGMQDKFTNQAGNHNPFLSPSQYPGTAPQQQQGLDAFWTACPFCNIRYQYYKNILNRALRCQNCMKPFIAYDMNAQGGPTGNNSFYQWNAPAQVPQGNVGVTTGPVPVPKKAQSMEPDGVPTGHAAEDDHANKKDGKKVQAADIGACTRKPEKNVNKKRGRKAAGESSESSETTSTDIGDETTELNDFSATQNFDSGLRYPRRSTRQKQEVVYNEEWSDNDDLVEPSSSKRSKTGIRSNGASSTGDSGTSKNHPSGSTGSGDKMENKEELSMASEEVLPRGKEHAQHDEKNLNEQEVVGTRKSTKFREEAEGTSHIELSSDAESDEALDYPEPEFYDFDQDRVLSKFEANQVWALYDTNDGMPRFYACIKKVFLPKFKVQFTWLEPNPTNEDETAWNEVELPIACGIFKHGDSDTSEMQGMFSYVVSWEKGARGSYKIFPKKGEVWALYKDWDISWSSDPGKHKKFKYEIVEVISDFDKETGVEVVCLVKVKEFVSLFQRITIKTESSKIPSKELLRFSHKIPSYRMTGEESKDIPEGCFELDPASMPLGLEEFEPYRGFKEKVQDFADKDGQMCSKSSFEEKIHSTEHCNSKTPGKKEPIEKNRQETGSDEVKIYSSRRVNGVCAKKPILVDESLSSAKKPILVDENQSSAKKDSNSDRVNFSGASGDKGCNTANGPKHQVENEVKSDSEGSSSPGEGGDIYHLPDSEFHNFETDRSADKFQRGQCWALYSDEDGFPKYYAKIEKVDDAPFHVRAQWLEACPVAEEEIRWSEEGLPVGCGTFKLTRSSGDFTTAKTFSHLIHPEPTARRGRFNIYPREDEIWAIYKSWRLGLSLADLVGGEFEIVQVLVNTGERFRVEVLGKVDGYRTVFRKLGSTQEIPRSQLLRFSHQIPAFHLTEERGGKLRGYLELDPASLPMGLLCTSSN